MLHLLRVSTEIKTKNCYEGTFVINSIELKNGSHVRASYATQVAKVYPTAPRLSFEQKFTAVSKDNVWKRRDFNFASNNRR